MFFYTQAVIVTVSLIYEPPVHINVGVHHFSFIMLKMFAIYSIMGKLIFYTSSKGAFVKTELSQENRIVCLFDSTFQGKGVFYEF